jgi:hypothetical protein
VAWQGPGIAQQVISGTVLKTIDRNPPVRQQPIADLSEQGATQTVLDLSNVFADSDLQDIVSLSVAGNTNPALVSPVLVGTELTLSYDPTLSGNAEITIRAVDHNGSIATDRFTVTIRADQDGDGIPDDWEIAHGLDPMVADQAADPDGDGVNNKLEYVADTHPLNAQSKQTFVIECEGTTPTIRQSSSVNRRYAIDGRESLLTGSWAELIPFFSGTGTEITNSLPDVDAQYYYRLRTEVPE